MTPHNRNLIFQATRITIFVLATTRIVKRGTIIVVARTRNVSKLGGVFRYKLQNVSTLEVSK
jgi:hypothetical protein